MERLEKLAAILVIYNLTLSSDESVERRQNLNTDETPIRNHAERPTPVLNLPGSNRLKRFWQNADDESLLRSLGRCTPPCAHLGPRETGPALSSQGDADEDRRSLPLWAARFGCDMTSCHCDPEGDRFDHLIHLTHFAIVASSPARSTAGAEMGVRTAPHCIRP
jgi:hypothetical protein